MAPCGMSSLLLTQSGGSPWPESSAHSPSFPPTATRMASRGGQMALSGSSSRARARLGDLHVPTASTESRSRATLFASALLWHSSGVEDHNQPFHRHRVAGGTGFD